MSFLAAHRLAAQSLATNSHCLHYDLARCTEEPDRFVLRIHCTSLEGPLDGSRKSEEFRAFLTAVRPFIANIEQMQHDEPTDVVSRASIYDAVGGAATMFRLARHFHDAISADPILAPLFVTSPTRRWRARVGLGQPVRNAASRSLWARREARGCE